MYPWGEGRCWLPTVWSFSFTSWIAERSSARVFQRQTDRRFPILWKDTCIQTVRNRAAIKTSRFVCGAHSVLVPLAPRKVVEHKNTGRLSSNRLLLARSLGLALGCVLLLGLAVVATDDAALASAASRLLGLLEGFLGWLLSSLDLTADILVLALAGRLLAALLLGLLVHVHLTGDCRARGLSELQPSLPATLAYRRPEHQLHPSLQHPDPQLHSAIRQVLRNATGE